jgi:hypothetical protein
MANPGPKRPADLLFPGRRDSIIADICTGCGRAAVSFDDALSEKEYTISGLCQQCQDKWFGKEEPCEAD